VTKLTDRRQRTSSSPRRGSSTRSTTLTTREVDVMLADVLAHVGGADGAQERLQPRLVAIVQKVLAEAQRL
jgi:putative intracellular protease/amidase